MEAKRLKISTGLQQLLITYLIESMEFQYTNILPEMAIFAAEEFYFRTSSNQLNLIIIKRVDSFLYVDLIGGGGGTGLFGITWGSETAFIKKAQDMLEDFCTSHGESIGYEE